MSDQVRLLNGHSYAFFALAILGAGAWIYGWIAPAPVQIDSGFLLFFSMAGIFACLRAIKGIHKRVAALESRPDLSNREG